MAVLISISFLKEPSRQPEIHRVSRVPVEGEHLWMPGPHDETWTVHVVIHVLDAKATQPVAMIRVK